MASFRPCVGQQRPCHSDYLPLSQGDSGFFQPDGFASFAGQTKNPPFGGSKLLGSGVAFVAGVTF